MRRESAKATRARRRDDRPKVVKAPRHSLLPQLVVVLGVLSFLSSVLNSVQDVKCAATSGDGLVDGVLDLLTRPDRAKEVVDDSVGEQKISSESWIVLR